ncbi:hypothetical protein F5B19DRAFT_364146 [Rostrohypoxylon terebratum]|nr:hypothetical protein F5B19DRAFT_364146 [Rostrohypoxylon terebratum]
MTRTLASCTMQECKSSHLRFDSAVGLQAVFRFRGSEEKVNYIMEPTYASRIHSICDARPSKDVIWTKTRPVLQLTIAITGFLSNGKFFRCSRSHIIGLVSPKVTVKHFCRTVLLTVKLCDLVRGEKSRDARRFLMREKGGQQKYGGSVGVTLCGEVGEHQIKMSVFGFPTVREDNVFDRQIESRCAYDFLNLVALGGSM